jgi:hypothetical protein
MSEREEEEESTVAVERLELSKNLKYEIHLNYV